jgi:phage baseplate assembly protein W
MPPDGSALALPFAIDARGRTALAGADRHLRDMIELVLFTTPGERVNRPEFGCGVRQLVFAPNSEALAAATEQLIHGALIRWLDSVMSIHQVQVSAEGATLTIRVSYTRRDTGEQQLDAFSMPIPA